MAESDRVDQFFGELAQRGYDPSLQRMDAVGRIDLSDGAHTARWVVAVHGGRIEVSDAGDREVDADWVMRADRPAFERVVDGDVGTLAALVRGTIGLQLVDPEQAFGLITRLFSRRRDSRPQRGEDESVDRLTAREALR